jgi:hypothetical protein
MAATMLCSLKNMIDTNMDPDIIKQHISKCIEKFSDSKQNQRGLITLIIRYYINMDNMEKVLEYLYMDGLMKRDYLTILEYFCRKNHYDTIAYIYSKIDTLETTDIDRMIDNDWTNLIERFDGYPVMTSYEPNDDGKHCIIYNMDNHIKKMRTIYVERIEVKDGNKDLTQSMKDVDIIIDGANMSYISGQFNPTELLHIIKKLEGIGYKVKVVFHPTRKITISELQPYLIFTPKFRNDDDYLLYGMLKFGKMVLTNDMFRDHVKNMDIHTKCYVESKTIRYFKKNLIIPRYSKCIQVNMNGIYIPSVKGGFYFLPSISASTPPPIKGAAFIGVAMLEMGVSN